MKKPSLRVTKWLSDIPVEAECTACPAAGKFRPTPAGHRPSRDEYTKQLQRAFNNHFKSVHASDDPDGVAQR